jgi:nucleotide-binding universal stress UspA family protein
MYQRQALDAYTQDLQDAVQGAESIASEAATRLREVGRDADAAVGRGDPAAGVIAFAENRQADLIVLGSRGRSALAEIVLGSVARNVLAGSKASVLVVRGAAATDRESGHDHSPAGAGAGQVR